MMKKVFFLLAIILLVGVPVLAQEPVQTEEPGEMGDDTDTMDDVMELEPAPDQIVIERENLFPEGIAYDPLTDQFLVGSLNEATLYYVAMDGTLTPFVDDADLHSTRGLHVDQDLERLLVAAGEPGATARLGIYNLATGDQMAMVDLSSLLPDAEQYFANDVTVDETGTVYVTDSFAGVIYAVPLEGEPEVWLQDESFSGRFTLNGIDYHPDGYLIAVRSGALMKIDLETKAITAVESDADFSGADGLYLLDDGSLVVVANRQSKVFHVSSEDSWNTAQVIGTFEAEAEMFPTTAAVRGDTVFVVYAQLNMRGNEDVQTFPIVKVMFDHMPVSE